MSNPWKKVAEPVDAQNLSDIMSEQYAKDLQTKEELKFAEELSNQNVSISDTNEIVLSPEILKQIEDSNAKEYCNSDAINSDAIIAKILQTQFDREYDDEIKRVEKKRNGVSKVSVSYDNYRNVPENLLYDSESDDDDFEFAYKKHWDRFETNAKEFASLPKRGFIIKDGAMVTKHDEVINSRRNACRVMEFPPEVCTGDGASFDMKLSNPVFNHLKEHTKHEKAKKNKMLDRKEMHATAELGVDENTRIILFKLVNNEVLEHINGAIATGKESVVFHAVSDPNYPDRVLPKECAVKVFKTTLNEFKTRDKYIEADYRFKNRFSKQNPRKVVHMWAEKEMHNMLRIQKIGINCPEMVCLKKHVLVMSFIGKDHKPAPQLRDAILNCGQWHSVYKEIVDVMFKLYNTGHLIHADLSEYNILWHENKCWIIDVSQSVQPDHPHALEFLLRDCRNITNFFNKKGVTDMRTVEELFKHITGFEELDINLLDGVHTTYNSLSSRFEIAPDDNRIVSYPFEYCWQKTNENKQSKNKKEKALNEDEFDEMWIHSNKNKVDDSTANFGNEIKVANNLGTVFDNKVNFGNELKVNIPITEGDTCSIGIEKKS